MALRGVLASQKIMLSKKYVTAVTELRLVIDKYESLIEIVSAANLDLRWRLAQLFESVSENDEVKFINLTGMQNHLETTSQKLDKLNKKHDNCKHQNFDSKPMMFNKNIPDQKWAKSLYKRSVKRCHPDRISANDKDYIDEMTKIYKSITASYENSVLDKLMVESYKVFVKPEVITLEQMKILESSLSFYKEELNNLKSSEGYTWAHFNDEMKEIFLVNYMNQNGINFVDKSKVKEVLKRKPRRRKPGERPTNILKERVKGKK